MGYDVYCALCGAATFDTYRDDGDDDDSVADDSATVPIEDTSWMSDVRIIGENPESPYPVKIYISGPAQYDDYGYFDNVVAGDDPYFFDDGPRQLRVYDFGEDHPLAIPVHVACYELFRKALGHEKVNREILYQILKSLCKPSFGKELIINYGPVAEFQGQYWQPVRALESFEALPTSIPQLAQYYDALPTLGSDEHEDRKVIQKSEKSGSDPFALLAPELLLLIMSNLDMSSINCFRAASRGAFDVVLLNSFWRARLERDMPWLYDLSALKDDRTSSAIDWARVYKYLLRASQPTFNDKIRGLVNRRRIWQLSQQIIEPYCVAWDKSNNRDGIGEAEVLHDAKSTSMPRLILPDPTRTESAKICLLNRYADLFDSELRLSVYWTDAGELAGLGLQADGSLSDKSNNILGLEKSFSKQDDVMIPRNDWLAGFIVTSREYLRDGTKEYHRKAIGLEVLFAKQSPVKLGHNGGDQRLIHVSQDHFIVGLIGNWSEQGVLSKLALLQQPSAKAPYGTERIFDHHSSEYNLQTMTYLWKDELPPPMLSATPMQHGYWAQDMKSDTSPMEAFILGTCEKELADLTTISADIQFGGLEAKYADGASRCIGPRRQAMKSMNIDGRGGERVNSISLDVGHIPLGLRIVTNWGRQLVVGHPGNHETQETSNGNSVIAGLYGYWSDRQEPSTRLDAVGILHYSSHSSATAPVSDGARDSHGFSWDPSPPPTTVTEVGRIWGQRQSTDRWSNRVTHIPGTGSIVSWLDCSRPLQSVRATLCHSTWSPQIPLSAITFEYADYGDDDGAGRIRESTIGPRHFAMPSDTSGTNGHPWCWCALGSKREDEMEARPHYIHDNWEVGGRCLDSVLVWLDADSQCLAGIQLIATDGIESARWGFCGGQPTGAIDFRSDKRVGDDDAVGVKFYLASNGRSVTREDTVVVALQAMKRVE